LIARLSFFRETLDEEKATDEALTEIAQTAVNHEGPMNP
jgi:ferritin-like metal-binding protein YciE